MTVGMDLLKQEGHIRYQRPHGLHALGVELHLALAGSVGDVPVLRGHHGHVHHLEHHVHGLERGRGTAATADGQRRCGLVLHQMACREEEPLHQREDATVRLAVIDRRADDERTAVHQQDFDLRSSLLTPTLSMKAPMPFNSPSDVSTILWT